MLLYILKSAACLAILLVFYKLLLEKENMHVFKRFYLLLAIGASLLVPAIVFTETVIVDPVPYTENQQALISDYSYMGIPTALENDVLDIELILWTTYFLGFVFFVFRFGKNIGQIIGRIRKNPKQKSTGFVYVLLRENFPPHTFLSYIFLNKKKLESNEIPQEVLLHEETHALQKHSWDVIFIEFLQVIFWFNPVVYLFRKAIKLNHEFLADQAVLDKDIDKTTYQNTLLSYLSPDGKNTYRSKLANAINYSSTRAERSRSIKKRFKVMKTKTSKNSVMLRGILLFPLLGLLLLGFSSKKTLQKTQTQSSIEGLWLDKETENFGLSIIQESNQLSLYLDDTSYPVKKIGNNYHVIMEYIDAPISLDMESGLLNFCGKNYIKETNSFRKKFEGAWNDSNGEINIKIENFTDEFIWTLTKNGSTNKFYPNKSKEGFLFSYGQDIWHFKIDNGVLIDSNGKTYTKMVKSASLNALEETDEKGLSPSQLIKYNELAVKYKKHYYGGSRILAEELNLMYVLQSKMNQEQMANSRVLYGFPKFADLQKRKKILQKQIDVYNILAKKYNQQPIETRVIPLNDLRILEDIYRRMTIAQKENVQPFPECLPENTQDGASKKQIAEYNALAKKYNTMLADGGNIRIKKSDVDRLEYLHGLMTHKQKAEAEPFPEFPEPPPSPKAPKVKKGEKNNIPLPPPAPNYNEVEEKIQEIIANQDPYDVNTINPMPSSTKNSLPGRNYDDLITINPMPDPIRARMRNEEKTAVYFFEPPTPPVPKSPLEHVKEMAKKDAIFYYEGKEISSDKAISVLKKNKKINLRTRHEGLKRPIVELSTSPIVMEN